MQTSVSQFSLCKPIRVESLPWAWGSEAGVKGESLHAGFIFFCGTQFREWERGHLAGQALAKRIQEKVLAEVRAQWAPAMPGAPADLVEGVADVEQGMTYCTPGTDWAVVHSEQIGD